MRIIIHEYPKSGGSWLVSLLGDALGSPYLKRDIDVDDDYTHFDVRKHPWYDNDHPLDLNEACVIKSHRLPGDDRLNFAARGIHLVRDGRDVAVSKYFYEKDFCVRNGIRDRFELPLAEYVVGVATEWTSFVLAWLAAEPAMPVVYYEDLLADPAGVVGQVLKSVGAAVSAERIEAAVAANTKQRFSASLDRVFSHNTFVRKGVAGDWENHLDADAEAAFNRAAGPVLDRLGYGGRSRTCR